MKGRIRKCLKDNTYTLSDLCPVCNTRTVTPHPFRFSPEDKYHQYRRLVR